MQLQLLQTVRESLKAKSNLSLRIARIRRIPVKKLEFARMKFPPPSRHSCFIYYWSPFHLLKVVESCWFLWNWFLGILVCFGSGFTSRKIVKINNSGSPLFLFAPQSPLIIGRCPSVLDWAFSFTCTPLDVKSSLFKRLFSWRFPPSLHTPIHWPVFEDNLLGRYQKQTSRRPPWTIDLSSGRVRGSGA